jgi:gamma-glutamyltranspeptidase/glutathione hydrolase
MTKLLLLALVLGSLVLVASLPGATMKPLVMGTRGVVAAGHPLVAEAGMRILQKGGNAVDAGVATILAAAVVEQGSFGMGGESPILIKPAGKPVVAINGVGIAPQMATPEFYLKLPANDPRRVDLATMPDGKPGVIPSYGPLSAIVPGMIDSVLLALENYGTMSFAEVAQPAIELAQGFPMYDRLATAIARDEATIRKWPNSQKVYLPNGRAPKAGEIFSQPDLVRTLQAMAQAERQAAGRGRNAGLEAVREYFYRGPVAQRISQFCEQAGCLLRAGDFAAFKARVEAPLTTNYRGIDVYKPGFWTQGPAFLENLNLLEKFDLKAMKQNSADYIHTVVEAMKLGYADRDVYYGDPDFHEMFPQLVSKPYADIRRPLIDPDHASAEHVPGDPKNMSPRAPESFVRQRLRNRNAEHQDTTCVNVADKAGNLFSATPSGGWVPAVIAGDTGIPLTERAQSFVLTPLHPNQIAPHKRPRVTLTPTIALKNGQPWLAFSTPGGDSQDQTLLQIFLDVVEFGMDPQSAVEAPRFNSLAMYSSFDDHGDQPLTLQVERRIPSQVLEQLRTRGHKLIVQGDWENATSPTMIEFDPATGVIKAGADVRGHRYAIAW